MWEIQKAEWNTTNYRKFLEQGYKPFAVTCYEGASIGPGRIHEVVWFRKVQPEVEAK